MKFLKTVLLIVFSILFFSTIGYAEAWTNIDISISPSVENQCVTVTGTITGMSEKMVTAVLYYVNNEEAQENTEILSSDICGHAQGKSDSTGYFVLTIPFAEDMPSGTYKVVVGGEWVAYGNTDRLKSEFEYLDVTEQLDFCEDVNDATSDTISSVLMNASNIVFNNDENLYEYSTFGTLFIKIKQEKFGESFDMTKESSQIVADINYCYRNALALSLLNESTDTAKKEVAIIDLLNSLSMSENIIDYRNKLMTLMNEPYIPYTGMEDFLDKAISIVAVEEINGASIEGITAVLENYKDTFGINLTTYNTLNKMSVNRYLWNKNFLTASEILTAFNNAVDAVKKQSNKPSNQGSSSNKVGGSSSGGFSGVASVGSIPKDDKQDTEIPKTEMTFGDLDTVEWAKPHIEKLYNLGIVAGRGNNEFAPDDLVLREEVAKMLSLSLELTSAVEPDFSDVVENEWYVSYVAALKDSGIISGYPDGTFGIGKPMTREDVATVIYRALSKKNIVLGKYNNLALFSDKEQISDYALEAVETLQQAGLINGMGDNTFSPNSYITRAQLAKMISVMLDLISKS